MIHDPARHRPLVSILRSDRPMATYLLTWNPERWPKIPDDIRTLESLIAATKAGETPVLDWNTGRNGQVKVEDRVFLVGVNTVHGIVGAGIVAKCRGKEPHFDVPDKEAYAIDVQWQNVLDVADVLPMDDLTWGKLGIKLPLLESGRKVPEQSSDDLEQLWNRHLIAVGRAPKDRLPSDDSFAVPMLFLRIGWMRFYEGLSDDDPIHGGGSFVRQHGYGHEMFNFLPFDGRFFGYVRPTSGGGADNEFVDGGGIKLERIVSAARKDSELHRVLVIWLSSDPEGGTFIVGWYRNATVYREHQASPSNSNRMYKGEAFGYYVSAAASDVVRLETTARNFAVPSHEKGGIGQSNVWYANDPEQHGTLRQNVLRYVESRTLPQEEELKPGGTSHQPDPLLRCKVEKAAVDVTTAHFEQQGYSVDSHEKDNLGWDLFAVCGKRELRLEVKGLSGSEICVELTPNEFAQMQEWRTSYHVCVVTNALTDPQLAVFGYSPESGKWQDDRKRTLQISKIIAARCSVE